MEEVKIVEGFREDFEKQINELQKKGWDVILDTHRLVEMLGKPYYSCVFVKEIKKCKN